MTVISYIASGLVLCVAAQAAERKEPMEPTPSAEAKQADPNTAEATFAAGCFWGVEHFFAAVPGVVFTEVGYIGGKTENPTYQQVCTGRTGHAEAVHLRYDPNEVSYETLLRLFFKMHDPTTPNRQGPDVGTQYRSAIFYHSDRQHETARQVMLELTAERAFRRRIVTRLEPAATFWPAEQYHQRYFKKNPGRSCHTQFCPTMLE